MNVDSAFKLFDIRGPYPSVVNERLAFFVGKALTAFKKPSSIAIACDTRESSGPLKEFLINGLSQECKKITDLFETPTPEFYFAMASGKFDIGIMITASHANKDENGMKIAKKGGLPFDQGEMETLKEMVKKIPEQPIIVPPFHPEKKLFAEQYLKELTSRLGNKKFHSKVVLNVSESSVVTPVMTLFPRLGINFTLAKTAHGGNPLLAQNRTELVKAVLEEKADMGIMWDSDGDRVVFVDSNGVFIPVCFVLGILAAAEVKKNRGGKVAVDVRTGLVVRDLVEQAGGEIQIFPAWSQFLKFGMKEDQKIVFGGEMSGHFVHKDFYNIDDGILSALKFLALWEDTDAKEQIAQLTKKYYELPEKNFPIDLNLAPAVLEKLSEYYRKKDVLVSVVDGLTVYSKDYRFNLRSSLTEPFLRLNLETTGENLAKEVISEIEDHIR